MHRYGLGLNIIPPVVYLILPLVGFYWANFLVYRDLAERVRDEDKARVYAHDGKTMDALRKIMNSSESLSHLREHDFGNTFDVDWFTNLNELIERCKGSDLEFLDQDLEHLRLDLLAKVIDFVHMIGIETFPLLHGSGSRILNSVPKELAYKQPALWTTTVQGLNTKAQAVIDLYDDLIRLAKQRL